MAPPAAATASGSGGNGGGGDSSSTAEAGKLQLMKDMLYDRVTEISRPNDSFSQDDLLDLGVIPNGDKMLLLRVIQELNDSRLFVVMRDNSGGVCWKWRPREEASKYVAARHRLDIGDEG